ncbi:MAG: hypothetical protein JST67_10725 [Bacteroidetes bacterium]|nr:hypothetical protein [Bacteroidota bacterium]
MTGAKKTKKIQLDFLSVELVKPQVALLTFTKEMPINVNMGVEAIEAVNSLVGKESYVSILNANNLYVPFNDFLKFILSERKPEKDNVLARALVAFNMAQKLDFQSLISLHKPYVPTKLFSEMNDEVYNWLQAYLASS